MHTKGNHGWDIEKSVCSSRQRVHALFSHREHPILPSLPIRYPGIAPSSSSPLTHSLLDTAVCAVPASILGVYLPQITTLQMTLFSIPPLLITCGYYQPSARHDLPSSILHSCFFLLLSSFKTSHWRPPADLPPEEENGAPKNPQISLTQTPSPGHSLCDRPFLPSKSGAV
ncbi:hypothetical protein BDP81DRAFT_165157 [Colletotrichum phormii]|uniref:Uncharacterized protein n=1 Tax=Colletotrichum phormii TaxID=359342 RepID=A0AAJ0EHJ8_9PEZI|nr:uncharacterized protein BDP81DRAFT_165157 [Colletotrichum phormii]KAK1640552.1 hypothetical protein BDP81DRAFT_165157 [Colletotrichum phormii]